MNNRMLIVWLSAFMIPALTSSAETEHRIGGGVHYLRTIGDIEDDDNFDEDSLSFSASYQLRPAGLLAFEFGAEYVPDFGGTDEELIQPQAYVLLGKAIYVGVGIGIGYFDGDWQDDPFYAFRAGLDLEVLPRIYLDINANYRFQDSEVLDTIDEDDLDAVTIGASLRIAL